MIVVSDSSPLVFLSKLNQLDSLQKLFLHVYITRDVYQEIVVAGAGLPGSNEVRESAWIEVKEFTKIESMQAARTRYGLGAGELSSIWLAKEMRADRLLVDDFKARRLAHKEDLHALGTIGLLEAFYDRGYLTDLAGTFRQLISEKAYIDERLLNRRLRALGLKPL